ncbi:RnfABCDGE type electron transport complex subunit D [Neosynechococcus sphagnicola]|uniref:RnfABCDGE type electron transport complex subunit D n=1 Tax=Neosynechococcus sphagnicola TaxID=1501145 RepID=UPI0006901424|nr:RnfABCDGE type electron transport complex subunit D [Neosynechococcus sphagnicola]
MWFRDARDYQILFLSLFLTLGIATRDWTLRPEWILLLLLTCLGAQGLGHWFQSQRSGEPTAPAYKSAVITALGLSLLLRADQGLTLVLAGTLAIASKFLLQVASKHWFNPANFGIVAALVLTQDAWVSPGQWGEEGWYGLVFLGLGGLLLKRIGRWETTVMFLSSYALLEGLRNFWLGWSWDVVSHRLMSGSLLLFALFMLTDPRSIPNARGSRLLWAGCIAVFTFVLRNQFYLATAPFWALFVLAPLTPLLDALWSAPRFSWFPTEPLVDLSPAASDSSLIERSLL